MPILALILTTLLMLTIAASHEMQRSEASAAQTDVQAITANLMIYRSAVAEYAYSHPLVTGVPTDAQLVLPQWWVHLDGVKGYVEAGLSYTYYPSPPPGLVSALAQQTESIAIGQARGARLINPGAGATDIQLPSVIPEGSAVAYR